MSQVLSEIYTINSEHHGFGISKCNSLAPRNPINRSATAANRSSPHRNSPPASFFKHSFGHRVSLSSDTASDLSFRYIYFLAKSSLPMEKRFKPTRRWY